MMIPYLTERAHKTMKQTLLMVRHGQTTWNVENRLQGQLPGVALTHRGRKQAAHLAEALQGIPISAIISSPLERARDTAEIIAQGRDLRVQCEPGLIDPDLGNWAGQVINDLIQSDPAAKAYVKDPTVAPKGVETFFQVQQRAVAAVEHWRTKKNMGAYPIFVAHAVVIKLLIACYSGLDTRRAGSLIIENASVSIVELEDENEPRVVAVSWSPKPGWLTVPAPFKDDERKVEDLSYLVN